MRGRRATRIAMLLVLSLSALALWTALAIATLPRASLGGRAETVVGATVIAATLVLVPIYVLGLLGALTRAHLALAAGALSVSVLAVTCRAAGFGETMARTAGSLRGLARMPAEALALAWRERSPAGAGLVVCLALFAYNLVAAYLAPSWREWDALWYHEPIIGFCIQNHGFAPVDLPLGGMQKINGYPRAGEMLSLWFAMFGGRALIDLPNVLLMPAHLAAVYALCRRATGDRVTSLGWAAVSGTMPSYAELLQTVYVDPALVAFVAAGALFALRAPARGRDAILAALALAIAANIKISGVFAVVPLVVIATARTLGGAERGGRIRAVAIVLAGAAWIVAFSAATYARNLVSFHNPVWPDLRVHVPSLGIDWPGNYPMGAGPGPGHVDNNVPLAVFLEELVAPPGTVKETNQKYIHLYGLGVIWVLFPLAPLLAVRLCASARDALSRWATPPAQRRWAEALALTSVALATIVTSTNRSTPRYHLPTLALLIPAFAWALGRNRALQSAVTFATTVGSLAVVAWEMPSWRAFPGPATLLALWNAPAALREITPEWGGTALRDTGLAREEELTAGTTIVSDDFVFPAVLWNNAYSNRVVYVRPTTDLAGAGDRLGATWLYAADERSAARVRATHRWQEIGPLYVEKWGIAFRRLP